MVIVATRIYRKEHVAKWEELERLGRLGPRQAHLLACWRRLKQDHLEMLAMAVTDGNAGVWAEPRKE